MLVASTSLSHMKNTTSATSGLAKESTYSHRLVQILRRLNQGEKLCPKQLAAEFGVTLRAIQRDLNDRFAFLNLVREDGKYFLPPAMLSKLQLADIDRFAALAGVKGLFPSLNDAFLREILDNRAQAAWLIKGHQYENLGGKETLLGQLEQAILGHHLISYTYQKPEGVKSYACVQPYKLVNHDGIWYLAGVDGDRLKAFTVVKMERLQVLHNRTFTPDAAIDQTLKIEDSIWLNARKIEVVLMITGAAASYFERRKLVASQVITQKLEAGGMIVTAKVAHANQILPTVREWIPHIRIISPIDMQTELEMGLKDYLGQHRDQKTNAN